MACLNKLYTLSSNWDHSERLSFQFESTITSDIIDHWQSFGAEEETSKIATLINILRQHFEKNSSSYALVILSFTSTCSIVEYYLSLLFKVQPFQEMVKLDKLIVHNFLVILILESDIPLVVKENYHFGVVVSFSGDIVFENYLTFTLAYTICAKYPIYDTAEVSSLEVDFSSELVIILSSETVFKIYGESVANHLPNNLVFRKRYSQYGEDIILDENTCILLLPLTVRVSSQMLTCLAHEYISKLSGLSLRYEICYLFICFNEDGISESLITKFDISVGSIR